LGDTLLDHRDRALLLLGFGAALRRSEFVALRLEHLRIEEEGFVLTLPRSKTNQEGRLETIAVAYGSDRQRVRSARCGAGSPPPGSSPARSFVGKRRKAA